MTQVTQRAPETRTLKRTWMKVARIGAIAMVVWSIALSLLAGSFIPPVVILGIMYLVFASLLRGERTRIGIVLAVVTVLAVAANLGPILDSMAHPSSAPSFMLTHLSLVAALVGVVAGLGIFRGWATDFIGLFSGVAVVVLVAGVVVAAVSSAAAPNVEALEGDIAVTARSIKFEPTEITLTGGSTGVWIDNQDGTHHTFTIEELGIEMDLVGLKSSRIDITADPGVYNVICTVSGHEDMTMSLVVEG